MSCQLTTWVSERHRLWEIFSDDLVLRIDSWLLIVSMVIRHTVWSITTVLIYMHFFNIYVLMMIILYLMEPLSPPGIWFLSSVLRCLCFSLLLARCLSSVLVHSSVLIRFASSDLLHLSLSLVLCFEESHIHLKSIFH